MSTIDCHFHDRALGGHRARSLSPAPQPAHRPQTIQSAPTALCAVDPCVHAGDDATLPYGPGTNLMVEAIPVPPDPQHHTNSVALAPCSPRRGQSSRRPARSLRPRRAAQATTGGPPRCPLRRRRSTPSPMPRHRHRPVSNGAETPGDEHPSIRHACRRCSRQDVARRHLFHSPVRVLQVAVHENAPVDFGPRAVRRVEAERAYVVAPARGSTSDVGLDEVAPEGALANEEGAAITERDERAGIGTRAVEALVSERGQR